MLEEYYGQIPTTPDPEYQIPTNPRSKNAWFQGLKISLFYNLRYPPFKRERLPKQGLSVERLPISNWNDELIMTAFVACFEKALFDRLK